MLVDTRDMLTVSDANARGVSGLVQDADEGRTRIITRNGKPAAAVVGIAELERLNELQENLTLTIAALARITTDNGNRHTLDDIAAEFGVDISEFDEDEDDQG
ncbi:MAG: type II toxin-antitoxin system prevent-host-death family antitoxin [Actinomycetota bacterium]|nr:type II toxin-antitoxin system prevent-host-death family antitoxin [Actinomycetota bacterium]